MKQPGMTFAHAMTDNITYAIVLKEIAKSFPGADSPVTALKNLSLQTKRGKVTGLVGPDGSGKTTLMRLISGLLRPDKGEIVVLGHSVQENPVMVQSRIGYMPQRFGLYEDLSVQENLDLFMTKVAPQGIVDIETVELSLEEVFLAYYGGGSDHV